MPGYDDPYVVYNFETGAINDPPVAEAGDDQTIQVP